MCPILDAELDEWIVAIPYSAKEDKMELFSYIISALELYVRHVWLLPAVIS